MLCYEAVFGEGLKPHGPAERAVLACRPQLLDAAEVLRATEGVRSIAELRKNRSSDHPHPRTARVNTLKLSVKSALSRLRDAKDAAWQPPFRVRDGIRQARTAAHFVSSQGFVVIKRLRNLRRTSL